MLPETPQEAHDEDIFFDTAGAARFFGVDANGQPLVAEKTMTRWRSQGGGPQFVKLGRRVVYRRRDLRAWAAARLRRSTSDRGEAR